MIVYFNGEYCEKSQVAISPDDRGFLFADGVYEVVRSYQGILFRMEEHLQRLANGLTSLHFPSVNLPAIQSAAEKVLQENQLLDATVYIQVTRGAAPRRHQFPPAEVAPTIYIEPKPFQADELLRVNGGTAILLADQRWARCDLKTVGLLPNVLAKQKAAEAGAFEALLVRDGAVLEGSHTNLFFVKDRSVITAPLNNYILPGISRQVVLSLAAQLGARIDLRVCFAEELNVVQEIFVTGTTSEITPITQVGAQRIGKSFPGPVTRQLQEEFHRLTAAPS